MREVTIRRILGAAVIPILMLIPTPSHQIPASDIWVVNESGYPVKDVAVTERYGFYAPRILTSDAQGHVRFEPRVPWTSFEHRLSSPAHPRPRAPFAPKPAGSRASLPLATR
jgi:hypothetical protein